MALYPLIKLLLVLLANTAGPVLCCYSSIFSFGDSLADTGNLLYLEGDHPSSKSRFPYGMTYFHHPTGRRSDGRLIIDFIAQSLGLPLLPPYLIPRNRQDFKKGANFAVGGATALDNSLYENRYNSNYSLTVQLGWFQQLLPSLCDPFSDCRDFFSRSLFFVGEIGGNDYFHPLIDGMSSEEIRSIVPIVIDVISQTIQTLIKHGAQTLMIPGNIPIGCSAVYITSIKSSNNESYNPKTGCLDWLNEFSEYHNDFLQKELNRLQKLHPHTTIIYADYYNAAMRFYNSPSQFGFLKGAITACCGGPGPYNLNIKVQCGMKGSNVCDNPLLYASWDGIHLTEAAYKIIATGLIRWIQHHCSSQHLLEKA